MKMLNIFKGNIDPVFTNRVTTLYDPEDKEIAVKFVDKYFGKFVDALEVNDYTGFCVDIEFTYNVGLVRLGELSEDTKVVRVWYHMIPADKRNIFGKKWTLEKKVVPLSTKLARDLVFTCEQVERYGCAYSLKEHMSDYKKSNIA